MHDRPAPLPHALHAASEEPAGWHASPPSPREESPAQKSPPGSSTPSLSGPAWVFVCVLLALAAFAPALLHTQWCFDDAEAIVDNPLVEGALPWRAAFERDYWEHLSRAGHYRPLAALSLRFDRAWSGGDPRGFHATNVVLHAAVVALAGVLLLLLGAGARRESSPWWGLALFAVHPLLADSVAWISGRTSMLSALGGLLAAAWVAHLTVPWRALRTASGLSALVFTAVGLLAALLSKEDALVFAPLLLALALRHSRALALWVAGGVALALGAYATLRLEVYGSALPHAPHAPLADAALSERLLFGGRAFLEALRLLAAPVGFPPNYESTGVFVDGPAGPSALLSALGWLVFACAIGAGLLLTRTARQRNTGVALLCSAAACASWMQFVPAGVLFAPRLVYLPLLFAVPLIGAAASRVASVRAGALAVKLALALALALSWQRCSVYASRESYWSEQLRWRTGDARAYNELGLAAEERGEAALARSRYEQAIASDASYGRPWSNLGRLLADAGELDEAHSALRRAVDLGAGNSIAWSNLGSVRLRLKLYESAREAYERATRLSAGRASAWRGLARAELELGELERARAALERALALDPADELARELQRRLAARGSNAASGD